MTLPSFISSWNITYFCVCKKLKKKITKCSLSFIKSMMEASWHHIHIFGYISTLVNSSYLGLCQREIKKTHKKSLDCKRLNILNVVHLIGWPEAACWASSLTAHLLLWPNPTLSSKIPFNKSVPLKVDYFSQTVFIINLLCDFFLKTFIPLYCHFFHLEVGN